MEHSGTVKLHQHLHRSLRRDDSVRYEHFSYFIFIPKRRRSIIKGALHKQNNTRFVNGYVILAQGTMIS